MGRISWIQNKQAGGIIMKKWKILLAVGAMIFACAGCGTRQTESAAGGGDSAAFAEQIKEAVADKDMDALAELCAYPLAVNGEVIETREAFMELGADVIFTEERCAVIEAVDVSALEDTMAGVIMGDGTPNIIFKSVDGELGITGLN